MYLLSVFRWIGEMERIRHGTVAMIYVIVMVFTPIDFWTYDNPNFKHNLTKSHLQLICLHRLSIAFSFIETNSKPTKLPATNTCKRWNGSFPVKIIATTGPTDQSSLTPKLSSETKSMLCCLVSSYMAQLLIENPLS